MQISGSHTREDLKAMQALDLEDKITIAQIRIREWYEHWNGEVYVSFSGGKDLTVLLHLVRQMYPEVPAVYCDTGLEYPEVREHAFSTPNVIVLHPKMDFRSVIQKYGYPVYSKEVSQKIWEARRYPNSINVRRFLTGKNLDGKKTRYAASEKAKRLLDAPFKVSHFCCKVMKKTPFHVFERRMKKHSVNGMMADESYLRETSFIRFGCNAFDSKFPASRPLMTWTEQDVLHYIKHEGLKIPAVYGEIVPAMNAEDTSGQCRLFGDDCRLTLTGVSRTGCMFCGFGAHLEKEPNRFQRMKKDYPKIWAYCLKPWDKGGLGMKEVLDFIGVKYE